jgi:hypothetical protein
MGAFGSVRLATKYTGKDGKKFAIKSIKREEAEQELETLE